VNLPRRFHGLDKAWVWMVRALLAFLGIGLLGWDGDDYDCPLCVQFNSDTVEFRKGWVLRLCISGL
jgi:hypothetical protein